MTMFGSQWLANAGASYEIEQSIRFNDDDAAYLYRDNSSAQTDTKKFTYSLWIKRGHVTGGTNTALLSGGSGTTSGRSDFLFTAGSATGDSTNDALKFDIYTGGWTQRRTTSLLRDPSAWYHIVLVYDAANSTANDTLIIYQNGTRLTLDSTSGVPNNLSLVNANGQRTKVGADASGTPVEFDGYMAEINMIDGQALAPTALGETNDDGVWVPKAYGGSYGTNGFYITGADSTALGADVRISGDQVISYAASQYTGATGSYTYSNGSLEADSANKAIKTVDTFAGDFEFSWRYVNMANFVIGVYETGEDGTFSDSSSAGNMQNMTDSWYIQTSSVAANRDIFYGGAVQVNATTIANGDTWKMTRSSGTIKLIRNGSDVHTFSQTSTNTVRIVVAQGDAAADAEQVAWVDNSTLGNNFFSTGMTTADQMGDTPTTVYPTINSVFDYYTSGNTSYYRPNYAVSKVSDGNLKIVYASPNTPVNYCTMSFGSSGKFYFEVTAAVASSLVIGIGGSKNIELGIGSSSSTAMANVIGYYANGTLFDESSSAASYGNASSIANGEFVGVAYSVDDDAIWFCDNGTWVDGNGTESSATVLAQIEAGNTTSAASTGFTDNQNAWFPFVAAVGDYPTAVFNFGQSSFTGSAPSGFTHLNTANTASPSVADGSAYFQPALYTGSTSAQDVTFSGNSDLAPDWLWFKARSAASNHFLFDKVRGVLKKIESDRTAAEATSTGSMTAFGTDGFSLGDGGSANDINGVSGTTYVAWGWAANGSGSSNTDGTVASTVSANPTAGFSIAKWTHTTASNYTVGHGLGAVPKMILVKTTDQGTNWGVYHSDITVGNRLILNTSSAQVTGYWGANSWTSSTFSIGSARDANGSTMIGYSFAEIPGYSSFGSYTGNGSADGTLIYTGFKPAYVLMKKTSGTSDWMIYDDARDPDNFVNKRIYANQSYAEDPHASNDHVDFLSNGFKQRSAGTIINASGSTYIYMAFAENPFGGDGVAPATAR